MEDLPIRHSPRSLIMFLFPSLATGVFTGVLIFCFKACASAVIALSEQIYAAVRAHPLLLPALVGGGALLGLLLCLLLKFAPDCKGGGIPTAITILRGLVDFSWLKSLIFLFPAAMLTYLGGVPLGNEGPSVQIGTAVGRGATRLFSKKNPAADRYLMTGGACAGFAAATGAPISGIFFAFEEAHRRFSPLIFMAASLTVVGATATTQLLCSLCSTGFSLFHFPPAAVLDVGYLWAPVAVGLVCALGALLFTKCYRLIRRFLRQTAAKVSPFVKIPAVFAAVALLGFFSGDLVGSGHALTEHLSEGQGLWWLLLVIFALRALLLIVANNSDVTGGLFVPTLALGAILGAVCAKGMISWGLLPQEHYLLMVVVGIASFMSASSRTPIIAVTFAVEALGAFSNVLPVIVGVSISFVAMEALGLTGFTDTVIEAKVEAAREGKQAKLMDLSLTVAPDAFADGKEIRDIFWPPSCTILSIHKKDKRHHGQLMEAGDTLHIHCRSYDPLATQKQLEAIAGKQAENTFCLDLPEEEDEIPDL